MEITVVGAYGYTGELICHLLKQLNWTFNIAGRDSEKLNALKGQLRHVKNAICVDVTKQSDVTDLLSQTDIVVSCAGPFTEESALLLQNVVATGKCYIDISGEVGFLKDSYEKYQEKAMETGALVLHGCAFESLIVDLILQQNKEDYQEVNSYYWFNQNRVSPGTKMTMKLSRYRQLLHYNEQQWKPFDINHRYRVEMDRNRFTAVPYPLPEIAFANWRNNFKSASSFLLINPEEAMFVRHNPENGGDASQVLQSLRQRKSKGPSAEERGAQRSKIILEFVSTTGSVKRLQLLNKDMYGTTAQAVILVLEEIVAGNVPLTGVCCPAQLFAGREDDILSLLNTEITTTDFQKSRC